jgi:hypothetical protein
MLVPPNGWVCTSGVSLAGFGTGTAHAINAEYAHHIKRMDFGYDLTGGGLLTVTLKQLGTTVYFRVPVVGTSAYSVEFDPPLWSDINSAVAVGISAVGGAIAYVNTVSQLMLAHSSGYKLSAATGNNLDCTVTLAASAEQAWALSKVTAGYSALTTGKLMTIACTQLGSAKTFTIPITVAGIVDFDFDATIWGDINTALTVTLPASGLAGEIGYLNVLYQ